MAIGSPAIVGEVSPIFFSHISSSWVEKSSTGVAQTLWWGGVVVQLITLSLCDNDFHVFLTVLQGHIQNISTK